MKAGFEELKGFGLNVFTEEELDTIHYATLQVMSNTGIQVESDDAVEILEAGGCRVEQGKKYKIVKMPPHVVEDAIRSAPSTLVYYGRDPKNDYVGQPGNIGFTFFGENTHLIDLETRKHRGCVKEDLATATRMGDALDELVVIEKCMGAQDTPAESQAMHNYEAMVSNTGKHCFLGFYTKGNAQKIVEMAAVCSGGMENFKKRPIVTGVVCPTSPLMLVRMACDVIVECAKMNVGIMAITMPLSGVTAPTTLAGTLVIQNCEILSALVLSQLTARGSRFTYGSCATIMDMKTAGASTGSPEYGMLSAAATKMAQYYKLPNWSGCGVSDSKQPDAQAVSEYAQNTSLAALSGSNIIFSVGSIESGLTFDYAKAILDTEYIHRMSKVMEGIKVDKETLALDVIDTVGPAGDYMTQRHTLNHMRESSMSKLFDRRNREAWEADGSKDIVECAYEKAKQILETHKPMPLPEGAAEKMKQIIADYEKDIK
ncbi:MAG: trimethylamine methyltransferase family protein [Desulfobacterales bacterium]|nr:trimethylamine methyltransferase family protein [Desulfobacterales bacterium]